MLKVRAKIFDHCQDLVTNLGVHLHARRVAHTCCQYMSRPCTSHLLHLSASICKAAFTAAYPVDRRVLRHLEQVTPKQGVAQQNVQQWMAVAYTRVQHLGWRTGQFREVKVSRIRVVHLFCCCLCSTTHCECQYLNLCIAAVLGNSAVDDPQ
jgi:hypothetical protein